VTLPFLRVRNNEKGAPQDIFRPAPSVAIAHTMGLLLYMHEVCISFPKHNLQESMGGGGFSVEWRLTPCILMVY
jgi:hypothetical protein